MGSRMDKYYKENVLEESRTSRNKDIYESRDEKTFEDLNLTSNISIIDADIENLDIDKIKDYLNERYNKNEPQEIKVEVTQEEKSKEDLIDTKEYDLNKVIEEAHKNKESDYDKERFRKLRDTQYDILKNLKIEKDKEFEVRDLKSETDEELEENIEKVEQAEEKLEQEMPTSTDETDLFADLLGSDDTEKIARIEEDSEIEISNDVDEPKDELPHEEEYRKPSLNEEIEKTIKLKKEDLKKEKEKIEEEKNSIEEENTTEETNLLNNSFYTGQYQIKESDLDEFEDLKKELKTGNFLSKALIVLLVLVVLGGIVFGLDMFLHLGLFK